MFVTGDSLSPAMTAGEERMETPGDVAVMLRLAELGWGSKRIAAELGCSRTTVKRYLRQGGWASYRGRPSALAGLEGWLAERFRQHRGNADVVARSWRASTGFGCRYGRSSGRWLICDAICLPRRGRACASRRRRAGSCRSISARRSSRSAKRRCGSIYSWRRWATRAAVSLRRSATSARPRGPGTGVPPLRWSAPRGPARQCQAAGRSPRCGDARGRVQRTAARLCALLGIPAARLCAVSGTDQGQGRERRRLREEERDRRP